MPSEPATPPAPSAGSDPAAGSGQPAAPPCAPATGAAGAVPASGAALTGRPVLPSRAAATAAFTDDDESFDAASFADPDDGEPFDAEAYFNPFSGPPEGADAWLARVASPVADEYLDSLKLSAGAREVIAAGFTHRDHEPGARGWAAGGPLDIMEPGPALAGFADDAVSDGLAALNDDELIGVMCAARRLASRAAGIELAAVAGLNGRREAHAAAVRDRRQAEHVADELAVVLTLTCRAADKLLDLATGVTRLPAVTGALAAGQIDLPKAGIYALELAGLGDEPAAAIAAITITDAARMTTAELGDLLRRLVLAHDPDAARRQRKKAQKDARVETWAESRGTAALAGRDLPPADVLAADKRIDAAARQLKKAGAPGTLEQLRAKVFIALLTSRPLYTLLPGNDDGWGDDADGPGNADQHADTNRRGGSARQGGRNAEDDGEDLPSGGGDGPSEPDDNPSRHGPNLGDRREPDDGGQTGGDDGQEDPGQGNRGGGTRRPGPGTGPVTGGPGTSTGPAVPTGLGGSVNLTIPLSTWLGLSGQPGEAAGHGPLDADTSCDIAGRVAAHPASRWCLTITDSSGRAIGHGCAPARAGPPPRGTGPPGSARPADCARPAGSAGLADDARPPGSTGPAGPLGSGCTGWLAGLKISWLETQACGHARETFAYQPSAGLRHLVKIRHRTCSFPGCRRPARWCDDDHTVPYGQGGRSCECNLSPLCRRHHGAKQAPGWHLEQPRPGVLIWTLPGNRTRTTTPRPYIS